MARAYMQSYAPGEGKLVIEELFANCVEVFYVPPTEKLEQSEMIPDEAEAHRVKLLLINGQDGFLTIFPTNTLGGHANWTGIDKMESAFC